MTTTKESYESTNPWNYWKELDLLSVSLFFRLLTGQMLLSLRCYINGIWPAWREDNSPEVKTQFFFNQMSIKKYPPNTCWWECFFFSPPTKTPWSISSTSQQTALQRQTAAGRAEHSSLGTSLSEWAGARDGDDVSMVTGHIHSGVSREEGLKTSANTQIVRTC